MNVQEAYLTLHKASGIAVGDKVKIVRAPFAKDQGQPFFAQPENITKMQKKIGEVVQITEDRVDSGGRFVTTGGDFYNWPFYCLELVEKAVPPITIGDKAVEFTDTGIKVGCQEVPKEIVKKIYDQLYQDMIESECP